MPNKPLKFAFYNKFIFEINVVEQMDFSLFSVESRQRTGNSPFQMFLNILPRQLVTV